MSDLVRLVPRRELIEQTVIEVLESALDAAKAGKVSSVAIAGLNAEGGMWNNWSGAPTYAAQLGSIANLQSEYIATMRSNAHEDD